MALAAFHIVLEGLMPRSFLRSVLAVVFVSFFFVSFASAQESGGTIIGYASDPDGVPIPGATVTAESEGIGAYHVGNQQVPGPGG